MKRPVYFAVILAVLISVYSLSVNTVNVRASGSVYIRADGSVDPQTAPISSLDNVTYTFTDDINGSLIVERNNVVIDGNGHTLLGQGQGQGLFSNRTSNVTIENLSVTNFYQGILMDQCSNILVTQVTLTNNGQGLRLFDGPFNVNISSSVVEHNQDGLSVSGSCLITHNVIENNTHGGILADQEGEQIIQNQISNNYYGLVLFVVPHDSSKFALTLVENDITDNQIGIYGQSQHFLAYHNNFVGNSVQDGLLYPSHVNVWNLAYPFGGNYWSDYVANDTYSGPYQNETGSDGIGDQPYTGVQNDGLQEWPDAYPLIAPWSPTTRIDANVTRSGKTYPIVVFSNATVSGFEEAYGMFKLWLSGETDTTGYIWIIQPVDLNASSITIFLNGTKLDFPTTDLPRSISTDGINYYIYLVVTFHSSYELMVTFPMKADVNHDGVVDIYDAIILAGAYNSRPGDPNWNPNADINGDGIVDIYDAIILASHYGQN